MCRFLLQQLKLPPKMTTNIAVMTMKSKMSETTGECPRFVEQVNSRRKRYFVEFLNHKPGCEGQKRTDWPEEDHLNREQVSACHSSLAASHSGSCRTRTTNYAPYSREDFVDLGSIQEGDLSYKMFHLHPKLRRRRLVPPSPQQCQGVNVHSMLTAEANCPKMLMPVV